MAENKKVRLKSIVNFHRTFILKLVFAFRLFNFQRCV